MRIYDEYRPRSLAEFIGKAKAVRRLRARWGRGIGGMAFFISGPSGGGKTTIGRILARTLAEVPDAAGHSNVATTSIYLRVVSDDGDQIGGIFGIAG